MRIGNQEEIKEGCALCVLGCVINYGIFFSLFESKDWRPEVIEFVPTEWPKKSIKEMELDC